MIVCGGRDFNNESFVFEIMDRLHAKKTITCLIEGGARGADALARKWAHSRNINTEQFQADWMTHGKKAGCLRNQKMIDMGNPNGVVAFQGGRGTADMIRRSNKKGLIVWEPKL